jgi:hypothetical protein
MPVKVGPHLLGRKQPPDQAHVEAHPYAAAVVSNVEVLIKRPALSTYDQGQTPECVGFSASKVINKYNGYAFDANWLYDQCKLIDPWPGEDGTSARYACDVLRRLGHWRTISGHRVKAGPQKAHGIASNSWATSVDGIRAILASNRPCLTGVSWREAWFDPKPDRSGDYWLAELSAAGAVAGGHEIGVWACSDRRQAFAWSNTWGAGWPSLGWVSYTTMSALLAEGGDATVLNDLPSR